MFFPVNMSSLVRKINVDNDDDNAPALKLNLLDAYSIRKMLTSWNSVTLFQIVQPDLDNMCFATFVVHYTVSLYSKIVAKKGKQSLQIPRFSPDYKSVKNTPHYYKSCWYSLLKFKPWSDYCETLLSNDVAINSCFDITNAPEELQNDIISSWESFLIDPINVWNANDDPDGYEGAIVLPPKCAMYMDNPVACVDYASLLIFQIIDSSIK